MFNRILVGTDGSDSAALAVAHAAGLAAATGSELIVVHAYVLPRTDASPLGGPGKPVVEIGKAILEEVERKHGGSVTVRTLMREGEPADVLCEVAEEENVDMIIVGNRGMSGAKRFVLGSVPNRVSHHAPTTVLIVHTT